MKKLLIIFSLFLATLTAPFAVHEAQAEPTITSGVVEDPSSPYLRGFSEIAFGALFGAAAAGAPILTGVFTDPFHLAAPLSIAAVLYPAGVASGMILGGYLTDSYSNYWAPFVGAYAGAIVADVTAYFLVDKYPTFSAFLVMILPIITSAVATEVSHTRNKKEAYYPVLLTFPF